MIIRRHQVLALTISVFLYGLLSEPTPDKIGFPEILMLLLISFSICYKKLFRNLLFFRANFYFSQISVGVILIWPMIGLTLFLNEPSQVIRDVIAACFICLPFFLKRINDADLERLAVVACLSGAFFSMREFANFTISDLLLIGSRNMIIDQRYLLQDPLVIFSALFSIARIVSSIDGRKPFTASLFLVLLLICLGSFFLQSLRLNIILVGLYAIYSSRNLFGILPRILYISLIALLIYVLFLKPEITSYLIHKFTTVGDNGKISEALQVINLLSDPMTFFGVGFGGEFFSGTYNSNVNFTHSFFTYLILKSGAIGLLYALLFFIFCLYVCYKSLSSKNVLLQVSILSMMPALLTQPTYKSFGFGIVALLTYTSYLNRK